jgi:DNA-binding NtrC family response regulator
MSNKKTKIIGKAYEKLKHIVIQYAKNDYNVLLVGERGSGKELFAEYFKAHSEREGKKLSQDCAGVPDQLLESEIFGHVKGSFTGATSHRKGKLETCKRGILFLDEIGDASENFQAAILRVVEQNSYSKLGEDVEKKDNDTLIIAATNKPQNLRDDLKDRFHVLYVPPLQKMDIPALAEYFLKKPLKKEFLEKLIGREYPGNVRELNRECEKLETLEDDEIFNKRPQDIFSNDWHFDYERYVRENEIWNKYLQPLIDKHGPRYLKYKYMEWDPNWFDSDSKDRNYPLIMSARQLVHYPEKEVCESSTKSKVYEHSTLDHIEWLRIEADEDEELPILWKLKRKAPENFDLSNKPEKPINDDDLKNNFVRQQKKPRISVEKVVPNFRHHMRECFDNRLLPLLLELIDQNFNTAAELPTTLKKPALSPLLDLPLKESGKKFAKINVEYNLKKHSNNKTKTAKVLGISMSKLNRALKIHDL